MLILEAIVVGLISMFVGCLLSLFAMEKDVKKFENWGTVLFTFFISGICVHFTCELLGVNMWQASHRPCIKPDEHQK